MEPSIQAIVRRSLPEVERGKVVMAQRSLLRFRKSAKLCLCMSLAHPDRVMRLPAEALLPVSQFLSRQPALEFWGLLHKKRLHLGYKDCWVQLPQSVGLGTSPYRFESEGEGVFYLASYSLPFSDYLMAQVTPIVRPTGID